MMNDADSAGGMPPAYRDFLSEAEDLLESCGQDLQSLETSLAAGGDAPEVVNSLFRSFHTIKGLAGMLSLGEIGSLAHALEDLLDGVRLGRLAPGEELLGYLFRGVELLTAQAKALGGKEPMASDESLVSGIRSLLAGNRQVAQKRNRRVDLDDEVLKTLTEYEEHRLRENIRLNRDLYLVRKSFPFEEFDQGLGQVVGLLRQQGEVISTLPSASEAEPGSIRFDLLWATTLTPQQIGEKLPLEARELAPIGYERQVEPTGQEREPEKDAVSATLKSLSETVRVDIRRLNNLMNIVGELVIYKTHLSEISREFLEREGMNPSTVALGKAVKSIERTLSFLQKGVIEARMVPIGQLFSKLHRVVRKLAGDLGKEVELKVSGEDTELDKLVIEDMADPLLHLIRNAIDHGIEMPAERERLGKPRRGSIHLSAQQKGNHIVVEIVDDGQGIDVERVRQVGESKGLLEPGHAHDRQQVMALLFLPGFSTSDRVTEVSGRGVGMDVVKSNVGRLRGMIDLDSAPGRGTTVTITLPMTLAIIQSLMVRAGDQTFAIPISSVLESVRVNARQIARVENKEMVRLRETTLPLLRLDEFFGLAGGRTAATGDEQIYIVVVGLAEKRLGLVVDSLKGQQEIVIKTLGNLLTAVRGVAGATELGDRRAVLVLDVGGLIQEVTHAVSAATGGRAGA